MICGENILLLNTSKNTFGSRDWFRSREERNLKCFGMSQGVESFGSNGIHFRLLGVRWAVRDLLGGSGFGSPDILIFVREEIAFTNRRRSPHGDAAL